MKPLSRGGRNRINLTAMVFGKWTVLRPFPHDGRTGTQALWWCRCECGNESEVVGASLRNATSQSCGCSPRVDTYVPPRGFGRSYRMPAEEAGRRNAILTFVLTAKRCGRAWTLSDELAWDLMRSACFYCGQLPYKEHGSNRARILRNGIDRLDNSKDYVSDNVVSCCLICNRAKGGLSVAEFIAHCKKIADHVK